MIELCNKNCNYIKLKDNYHCSLYDKKLNNVSLNDEFDTGKKKIPLKCDSCMKKLFNTNIEQQINDIIDTYSIFVYDMDEKIDKLKSLLNEKKLIGL